MTFALWLLTAGLRPAVLIVRISWVRGSGDGRPGDHLGSRPAA
jgi:hypothetical protein